MKQIFLVVLIFLCFCGCEEPNRTTNINTINTAKHQISYFKDPYTNLCFATLSSRTYRGSIVVSFTCVPCTEEVLRQLK